MKILTKRNAMLGWATWRAAKGIAKYHKAKKAVPMPKKKTSKSKSRSRRAANWTLKPAPRSTCPRCNAVKVPHVVCANCGWYGGRQAIDVD